MANTRSALKRIRQAEVARARNSSIRSSFRTAIKKVREAVAKNDSTTAQELLRLATRSIDKAATKGVIKGRAASRKISRLAKSVAAGAAAK
ncbi:SSU ribosomal protein S20p [Vulgatibacter incomptus]|uniref:Small ribosomal subunit protein bS20 n=1 Tax=Vulgatibacter incomptus TaxID=1391653 RepID=A0A0K1PAR4_9BACT|nr:30S ribosomal protein S20 [Vulgatibacter incomptus]AKU90592.1 SSU ribosomal protein S20p [Vulgatibacter incomptus]